MAVCIVLVLQRCVWCFSPWSMSIEEWTIQNIAVGDSLVDLLLLCPYSKGCRAFPLELSLLRYQRVLWQHPLWQESFQNLSSAGCHFCHFVVLFWARSWSPGHVLPYFNCFGRFMDRCCWNSLSHEIAQLLQFSYTNGLCDWKLYIVQYMY